MFYGKDQYMAKAFTRYRELFFSHFEWKDTFSYKIVDTFDELVNESDYVKYKSYFTNYQVGDHLKLSIKDQVKKSIYLCVQFIKVKLNELMK